ncbi:Uncharacterised protein [Serratia quinivorans]|nr:Uncharacterised protein [Serratia quinivorans]
MAAIARFSYDQDQSPCNKSGYLLISYRSAATIPRFYCAIWGALYPLAFIRQLGG